MPKKQVYSPVNAAETQHYDEYRDEPGLDQDCSSSNITNTTMPSGAASIKSAISKKSRKSRRIVDNDELSVPLHAMAEGGDDQHEEVQFHDDDLESGGAKGASVSLDDDPFYVFREDLTRKLYLVDDGLKNYLNVIHDTDTAVNTHDVKDSKKQLKRHIKNAEATLNDLQMTVNLVESKRDQFTHIDDGELYDRRTFVQTSAERIAKAKREMSSESVRSKTMADERAMAARRVGDMGARTQAEKETTEFVVDTRAQAQMMLNQQDEALDDLDLAVNRVGVMAEEIHEELGQQNKMLTELDDDLADAEEKLGLVMGKLAKLLKTKNKCQLGTILILCLIALILFFLVLYT
mmetsp:Transcript_11445/g.25645  ORF Transcript_11445/g.25645 Transcript_11445/m.25645 type:complete len:349 (-) Transcript_11445:209-1255(-)